MTDGRAKSMSMSLSKSMSLFLSNPSIMRGPTLSIRQLIRLMLSLNPSITRGPTLSMSQLIRLMLSDLSLNPSLKSITILTKLLKKSLMLSITLSLNPHVLFPCSYCRCHWRISPKMRTCHLVCRVSDVVDASGSGIGCKAQPAEPVCAHLTWIEPKVSALHCQYL